MTHHQHQTDFDQTFWQDHWQQRAEQLHQTPPHPYLVEETQQLVPGTALDAGCGTGAEALWLAEHGWQVTGVDISDTALDIARQQHHSNTAQPEWICADLTTWEPNRQWDLVVTSYAHTSLPQLELYTHVSHWVAPGGTLLIIAHDQHDAVEDQHPIEATAQDHDIVGLFTRPGWKVETARQHAREFHGQTLHDVIVRIQRTDPGDER